MAGEETSQPAPGGGAFGSAMRRRWTAPVTRRGFGATRRVALASTGFAASVGRSLAGRAVLGRGLPGMARPAGQGIATPPVGTSAAPVAPPLAAPLTAMMRLWMWSGAAEQEAPWSAAWPPPSLVRALPTLAGRLPARARPGIAPPPGRPALAPGAAGPVPAEVGPAAWPVVVPPGLPRVTVRRARTAAGPLTGPAAASTRIAPHPFAVRLPREVAAVGPTLTRRDAGRSPRRRVPARPGSPASEGSGGPPARPRNARPPVARPGAIARRATSRRGGPSGTPVARALVGLSQPGRVARVSAGPPWRPHPLATMMSEHHVAGLARASGDGAWFAGAQLLPRVPRGAPLPAGAVARLRPPTGAAWESRPVLPAGASTLPGGPVRAGSKGSRRGAGRAPRRAARGTPPPAASTRIPQSLSRELAVRASGTPAAVSVPASQAAHLRPSGAGSLPVRLPSRLLRYGAPEAGVPIVAGWPATAVAPELVAPRRPGGPVVASPRRMPGRVAAGASRGAERLTPAGRVAPAGRFTRTGTLSLAGRFTPADRFTRAVARRRRDPDRPLPLKLRPLADMVVGPAAAASIRVRSGPATAAALAEAGRRAATVDNVVHLPAAPDVSARTAEVVAHELVHASRPSPAPRFFDDDNDSPEERQAAYAGRRVAALIRAFEGRVEASRTGSGLPPDTAGLAVAPGASPLTVGALGRLFADPTARAASGRADREAATGGASGAHRARRTFARHRPGQPGGAQSGPDDLLAQVEQRLAAGGAGGLVFPPGAPVAPAVHPGHGVTPVPGATPGVLASWPPSGAAIRPPLPGGSMLTSGAQQGAAGQPLVDQSTSRISAETLDWIVEAVEERVLAELERRGVRFHPEVF